MGRSGGPKSAGSSVSARSSTTAAPFPRRSVTHAWAVPPVAVSRSERDLLYRPCRPGGHLAAARVGRFGRVAMIESVLWSGVRYANTDDGVTIP